MVWVRVRVTFAVVTFAVLTSAVLTSDVVTFAVLTSAVLTFAVESAVVYVCPCDDYLIVRITLLIS